jgi:glutamate dehydrogenase/leucine dehydrogenase
MNDPYLNAVKQLSSVAKILDLPKEVVERLATPDKVWETKLKIRMDSGKMNEFVAYRSQHNNSKGPYKGGIRFHPEVSLSEVKALSMWMSWKCSVASLPYGGGKGGVAVDPKKLSVGELERLSRAYGKWASAFIGPWLDVPAPDVNTNGQIMAWMLDEVVKSKTMAERMSVNWNATFTGKPLDLGGSLGREEATGMGGVYTLENLIDVQRKSQILNDKLQKNEVTIAVQGIGNVGYWFAKLARAAGYKVVAISDSRGGVYSAKGLDIEAVVVHKQETGNVGGCKGAKDISNEELLLLPVTVLVPAALENVITEEIAKKIQAKYIIEMANGPVTPEADKILVERGILSVPDVLANAGGVTVSYFEWVQNLQGFYWTKDEVLGKLKGVMDRAFLEMWEAYKKLKVRQVESLSSEKISLRMAAYANAVSRVVAALR